ncbi:hypothetical protein [Piscinibacter sp.]|uniref:hypothetical protein n=1 Tax=Piscinibacter sp. TaxID=1903157 RepID=UPI00355A15A6
MKSAHIVRSTRPMQGLVAFVPVSSMKAAMKSFVGCANAQHLGVPAGYRQLDRNENPVHPGEGSA